MESISTLRQVAKAAASILDGDVVFEAAATSAEPAGLFPEEQAHLAAGSSSSSWAPARQREFATARGRARRALLRLGVEPCALVPHVDRSPRWPDGIVGSITHTRDLSLVAVARRGRLASIGVDIERVTDASTDIEELVCTPAERQWLDDRAASERGANIRLFFSAKEAFYKCQYPLTKTFLDFQDVELAIDTGNGTFAARIAAAAHARLNQELAGTRGRWASAGGLVVTAATLS